MMRLLVSLMASAAVLGIAWCSGLDFDTRCLSLGEVVFAAIAASVLAYTHPYWDQP